MDLQSLLERHRDHIIRESVRLLHGGLSKKYKDRPVEELVSITTGLIDANSIALLTDDYYRLDEVIGKIVRIRHESGFSLPEVHKALELYRTLLFPILFEEQEREAVRAALEKLNAQTGYCISRFSDYFQILQEKALRNYAEDLEGAVRKRTNELAESEAKHRGLIEAMDDGYFVIQQQRIVFANRAFCRIHGYALPEVVGRLYCDFIACESLAKVQALHEEGADSGKTRGPYKYYRLRKDGKSVPTENKITFIMYQGEPAVAGLCRDITERVELERRVRESERLAYIGELTTSLAHEIRNPLSSVKMNIQILLKGMNTNERDNRRAEIVVKAISRLERILTEMLDFARPLKLNLETASIRAVIDGCLEMLDVRFKERNIVVKKKCSTSVPDIPMDADKMQQAIINVLVNSLEAIEKDGVIEIAARREAGGDGVRVRVDISDTGSGIEKKAIPFVFDPFYSNKRKGTGLGLYNVKKIVEAHGGTIRVSSKKLQGAKFSLFLPVPDGI